MIRKAFSIIAVSLLLCIACQAAWAQNSGSPGGTIRGFVTGVDNQTVPNASVSLYGEGASPTAPAQTTTTDTRGYYSFDNLSPGNYSIDASKDYYVYTTTTGLGGGTQMLNLTLPISG